MFPLSKSFWIQNFQKSVHDLAMATDNSIADDQEAMQHLSEISKLLNTGLDETALTACVRLLEAGN